MLPRSQWKRNHYPILKLPDFEGCDGLLIKDVAVIIGRTYEVTKAAIHRLGIRNRFPAAWWPGDACGTARVC